MARKMRMKRRNKEIFIPPYTVDAPKAV